MTAHLRLGGKIELRDYQRRALDELYRWFDEHPTGHPCLVLPTGAGKSHIVAALCKEALQSWPETRVLMATHVKELIEQNAEKMRAHWPNAPMGIYSASIGRKQLGEPITFAGIQSIRGKADRIGHVDLVIVDECHLISHEAQGGYRTLIDDLQRINPALRVVGLTATPYRLGHGMITDAPAIFSDLIEPVLIEELLHKIDPATRKPYLAPLRSKVTGAVLDVASVHKRGGEYIESELQAAVDTDAQNRAVVAEIIARADGRRSWLIFCAGIAHAEHVDAILREHGVASACVTGKTANRDKILEAFKAEKLTALTNANVLTTGFDHPGVDLIAFLRPTLSPGLYVQMAGRGMRPKPHTDHCLVLDFAGNVERHGPITAVAPPGRKRGEAEGDAPSKTCAQCGEIVAAATRVCPSCGAEFPPPAPKPLHLRHDDIMGIEPSEMAVASWTWRVHESRSSGKRMLAVTYHGGLFGPHVDEYFTVTHEGEAGYTARIKLAKVSGKARARVDNLATATLEKMVDALNAATPPTVVKYKKDGKFCNVTGREWVYGETPETASTDRV